MLKQMNLFTPRLNNIISETKELDWIWQMKTLVLQILPGSLDSAALFLLLLLLPIARSIVSLFD